MPRALWCRPLALALVLAWLPLETLAAEGAASADPQLAGGESKRTPVSTEANGEPAPAPPTAEDNAEPVATAERETRPAYRVVVDAPGALKEAIERSLGLVRWQSYAEMTPDLLDRLLLEASEQARDAVAAEGYFSAQIAVVIERPAAATDALPVVRVKVNAGPATRVTSVSVRLSGPAADAPAGTEALNRAREGWRLPVGEIFRQEAWDEAKMAAVATIAASPYASARVERSEARIDPDEQSAELAIAIESGPAFTFGPMEITGLKRYSSDVVRNFSDIAVGEPYSEQRLDQFIRRLNLSGYFASVQASIDAEADRAHDAPIRVSVIEARPRSFEGGLSYTTDTQFRANVRYSDADFDDRALQFLVDGRVDRKIQQLTVRLTRPPDREHYLDTAEAKVERTDIEDLVTTTAFAGVNRRTLDERDHAVYRAYYYLDDQRPAGAPSIRSRALYLEYERTWRRVDDLIAPTRGFVLGTHWGGGPPGVSTEPFGRIVVQYVHWHPFGANSFLRLRAEAGAVLARTREGIPSALLFRTGGDTTVRGYAFESLGVPSGNATVPGRYYAIGSIEADHYVTPVWGLAAFVDAGNAADDLAELRPVLGYGVGVRIRSPIGPLRVDVAYGQETRQVRLHLSVGLSF